jgi:hypothetical protein
MSQQNSILRKQKALPEETFPEELLIYGGNIFFLPA